jgi:hypothetical protein
MKNSSAKLYEPNKAIFFNARWIREAIVIMALLLPAGAAAQSSPEDQEFPEEDYQQQRPEPDYSNPYQTPVISQYEQDQLDQAGWLLGVPESRRPKFSSFFEARDQARQSILDKQEDDNFELQKRQTELDLRQQEREANLADEFDGGAPDPIDQTDLFE